MTRNVRSLLAILVAVLSMATPVRAASCNGASHQPTLSNGTASPGSALTGTPITFAVVYADSGDCQPSAVSVTVAGVGTFPLSGPASGYAAGVTYSIVLTLAPGSYAYSFAATSGDGNGVMTATLGAVSPTSVSIVAPPPPTPAPTPKPPPPATPKPAPVPPRVTPPPPPAPTATASPTPTPGATATPDATATPGATSSPSAAALNLHDSWSPAPAALSVEPSPASGSSTPFGIPDVLLTYVVTTTLGLGLFLFLMRRPMASAIAPMAPSLAAARPAAMVAAAPSPQRVTPLPSMRELIPPVDPDLLRDRDDRVPDPDEAGVPRWLRPSVRGARGGATQLRHRDWRA